RGVAAATVSHQSARIGDADETWRHGVVSQLNDAAREFGLRVGDEVSAAITRLLGGSHNLDHE
ncbi:MAG TPA: hypothetical protein VNG69_13120, partial [Casimicrobiaceae bacterium]|nr:hypothetical protein [Casimicrobiaceae bacterium]